MPVRTKRYPVLQNLYPTAIPNLLSWFSATRLLPISATKANGKDGFGPTLWTPATGPTIGNINLRKALSWSGASSDSMTGPTITAGQTTILAVIRPTTSDSIDRGIVRAGVSNGACWTLAGAGAGIRLIRNGGITALMNGQGMSLSNAHVIAGSYANNTSQWTWVDGSFSFHSGVTNTPVAGIAALGVGNSGAAYVGQIAEVALFSTYFSDYRRLLPILQTWGRYYGVVAAANGR